MEFTRTLVMACATVMEEMLPLIPEGMQYRTFDFGLHVNPRQLRQALQEMIDSFQGEFETVILGYGMCAQAVIGLRANGCRLVAPRVEDCIALFLGSNNTYANQRRATPGTYYLTKGWIEVGDTPFRQYEYALERYGEEFAQRFYKIMMGNYTRLALINTGQHAMQKYRAYARRTAKKFGLHFEEIQGSDTLIKKLLYGPWDEEIAVLEEGEMFQLEQFLQIERRTA